MTRKISFFYITVIFLSIQVFSYAQQSPLYVLDKKIDIPGDGGYDYLSIDSINNRLYVSHGTTVNIIDLGTEKLVGSIDNLKGVHGIAIANDMGKGFISDGKANAVVVFDLKTYASITVITISGKDPDAITYDIFSHRVFTFNGDSKNSSVIDASTLKQIGTIDLGGTPEFAVPDGNGKIFNNVEDKSSLNIIDTKSLHVVDNFSLSPCGGPTGMAVDLAHGIVFTVCRQNKGMSVVDIASKKIITTLPIGAGVDAVAYDPSTQLIFCSNGDGSTTIIKQQSAAEYSVVQTLVTQVRAKTLALDRNTHKIYLSAPDFEKGTKNRIPGSFKVLVYRQQ